MCAMRSSRLRSIVVQVSGGSLILSTQQVSKRPLVVVHYVGSRGPFYERTLHQVHLSKMLGQVSRCAKRVNRQLVAPIFLRKNHGQATPGDSQSSGRTTSFGFKTVPEESKESLVKGVFDNVASKYDLMNDASSLGVHRVWKDTFVSTLKPGRRGPIRCIDVAGGTGDIALRILDHAREEYADRETTVEIVDINAQMLGEGFKRFKKTMYHNSECHFRMLPRHY